MKTISTPLQPATILAALSGEIAIHNSFHEDGIITRERRNAFLDYAAIVRRIAECPRPVYGLTCAAILVGPAGAASLAEYRETIEAVHTANPDENWFADRRDELSAWTEEDHATYHAQWRQNHPLAAAMIEAAEAAAAKSDSLALETEIHPALRHPAWLIGWHESLETLDRYCCDHVGGGLPIHSMNMLWAWIERIGYLLASHGPRTPHEAEVDARWGDIRNVDVMGYNAPHADMAGGQE